MCSRLSLSFVFRASCVRVEWYIANIPNSSFYYGESEPDERLAYWLHITVRREKKNRINSQSWDSEVKRPKRSTRAVVHK